MMTTPFRRRALLNALAGATFIAIAGARPVRAAAPEIQVWKTPTCGCCNDWIRHLQDNGFAVRAINVPDTAPIRSRAGIPARLGSCHTALVDGYAIEGHVPARDIQRLLRERPKAVGVTVPGMPIGSPGMDGPAYGNVQQDYQVLLVRADGSTQVFARYPGQR
jgi:hypothetical protein